MKRYLLISLFILMIPAVLSEGWLNGWNQRINITFDHNDVDNDLTNFPVLIFISDSCGIYNENLTFVFDNITDNRKKIAFTKDDGTTQLYCEIEEWDYGNEKSWLWVKVNLSSTVNTTIYFYYDSTHADNTDYIGDANSVIAKEIWDSDYVMVQHLEEITGDGNLRYDSTTEDSDLTMQDITDPTVSGMIDTADDFEKDNTDYADGTDDATLDLTDYTVEVWFRAESHTEHGVITEKREGVENDWHLNWLLVHRSVGEVWFYHGNGVAMTTILNTAISDGTWYYIVGTYNHITDDLILYRNGVISDSDLNVDIDPYITGDQTTKVGRGANDNSYYLDGTLDELRLSKIDRTPTWIETSYETERDDLNDYGSELTYDEWSPEEEEEEEYIVDWSVWTQFTLIGTIVYCGVFMMLTSAIYLIMVGR